MSTFNQHLLTPQACHEAKQDGLSIPEFHFVSIIGATANVDLTLRYVCNEMGAVIDLIDNEQERVVATITRSSVSKLVDAHKIDIKYVTCASCGADHEEEYVDEYCTSCGEEFIAQEDEA